MLSPAVLIVLAISAVAIPEAPSSLFLRVSGPSTVSGVQNMNVVVKVENTGVETLKLLNDPRGPLSKLPTNAFSISHKYGASPVFTGMKAKYVKEYATSFTTLAPGDSVEVEHSLAQAYNFTRSGSGAYTIGAHGLFYFVDPKSNAILPIYAKTMSHSTNLSGKLDTSPGVPSALRKRATFDGCDDGQQFDLNTAAPAAQRYAVNALKYLYEHTSASHRHATWFGQYDDGRHNTLIDHFTNMNGTHYMSFNFDCTCTEKDVYAYVYPDQFGTIYLCGAFWKAPPTGTDSKAGTLVHESSHFTKLAGTNDHTYGKESCEELAQEDPDAAVNNADSHEYFAENSPAQD